jgi:hypothetical protein
MNPLMAPITVGLHRRDTPTPTTIVTISMVSTDEAANVGMRTALTFTNPYLPARSAPGRANQLSAFSGGKPASSRGVRPRHGGAPAPA